MTALRAVLVDLDGTLVDTAEANYQAYRDALAEAGVSISRDAFLEISAGRNWRQFLPTLLEGASEAQAEQVAARKAAIYPGKLPLSRVNEGLVRFIEAVRPACKTALVTTASAANAVAVLQAHDLQRLFDLIVSGSDVARHKPDPEAYILAARRLEVEPTACLIIEDSAIGVASARAFGAPYLKVSMS
jgi:HAD superfamily hydrolase (TIGR01509 family)